MTQSTSWDGCIQIIKQFTLQLDITLMEWYVVTKGKILSLAFFFCVKADGLAAKLTAEKDLSMTVLG